MPPENTAPRTGRLTTWRQIGDFLGKDERTAKRWEATRAMPVHRVPGGGNAAVYAFADELERWLAEGPSRRVGPPATEQDGEYDRGDALPPVPEPSPPIDIDPRESTGPEAVPPTGSSPLRRPAIRLWTAAAVAIAVLALLAGVAGVLAGWPARSGRHAPKPAAVELYRHGRFAWSRRTPESLRAALADFTQAAVQDPDYADAYVGLADTYNLLREYSAMSSEQAYPQAERAARRALALDERSAAAHAALAFVEFHWGWDAAAARRDFERAIALDPASSTAHQWYATALLDLGDYPAALRQIGQAEGLAPESAAIRADKAIIINQSGRPAAAEALLKQLVAQDPGFSAPHQYLSRIYMAQRRWPEYLRELRAVAELKGDDAVRRVADASVQGFAADGERGLLRESLALDEALYGEGRIDDLDLAEDYAKAGRPEAALRHLAAAIARHDPDILLARTQPWFRDVRTRPEFGRLFAHIS